MSWIELVAQRRQRQAPTGVTPPDNAADWYRIQASSENSDETDIFVYDAIGGWCGMYADDFIRDLKDVTTRNINLRVNSPGGSVFEGIAIANAIRMHPANVTVYVDSLAASIASVIALAGNRLVMMPQSQLMIHDASGVCYGNADDMKKMVDLLEKQSDNIAEAYADRAGGTAAEWRDRMKDETWYTAKEAVAAGLADEFMTPPKKSNGDESAESKTSVYARMHASWDLAAYKYAGREEAPGPLTQAFLPGQLITAQMANSLAPQPGELVVRADLVADMTTDELLDLIRATVRDAVAPPPGEEEVDDAAEEVDDAAKKKKLPPFLQPDEGEEEEEETEDAADSEAEPEASAETPAEDPVDTGLANAEDTVEPIKTSNENDEWQSLVGRLVESPSPSADDVFNRLKEAWL